MTEGMRPDKPLRVALLGIGGVGSQIGATLAKTGQFEIVAAVDPDEVEPRNLSKAAYSLHHVGMRKVDALEDILKGIAPPPAPLLKEAANIQDLDDQAWDRLLGAADLIIDSADSRGAKQALVRHVRNYTERTGRPVFVLMVFALDNLAAAVVHFWPGTAGWPCPVCLIEMAPYLVWADERTVATDEDYCLDRVTFTKARGVLPDLLFVASYTTSLALALKAFRQGEPNARATLLDSTLMTPTALLSPFRDPALPWQRKENMGLVKALSLDPNKPCPVCGLNGGEALETCVGISAASALPAEVPVDFSAE